MLDFRNQLAQYINAGFQSFVVENTEMARVEADIRYICDRLSSVKKGIKFSFITWDCVNGCSLDKIGTQPISPLLMLQRIEKNIEGSAIIVLRNFDIFLREPLVAQKFQMLCESGVLSTTTYFRPIVISGAAIDIPKKLKHLPTRVDYHLPDYAGRLDVFEFMRVSAAENNQVESECSEEQRHKIVTATAGLTRKECEDIISLGLVRLCRFEGTGKVGGKDVNATEEFINVIEEEKARTLRETSALEYFSKDRIASEEEVGGFGEFKRWMHLRRVCFTEQGEKLRLDFPKGVVLIGVPGVGKSLIGKAAARILRLPLLRFDISSVFGSLVGESEKKMREVLSTIDALEGCVVLVDEADKVWGGASDAVGDSGVTRRVFGSFLTWLQEKKSMSFVIMTMNRTTGIPPEFLRKGRFDDIFFVDFPTTEERREIFDIHMKKRGLRLDVYSDQEWTTLINATHDFCGAEIEDLIKEAMLSAATSGRDTAQPTFDELQQAAAATRPLAQLDAEGVQAIQRFCQERARPASSYGVPKRPAARRRSILRSEDAANRG